MRRPSLNGSKTLPDHGFLDSVRLHSEVYRSVRRYEADREALMRAGKAGDFGALHLLQERFGLRLPLAIEDPWEMEPMIYDEAAQGDR